MLSQPVAQASGSSSKALESLPQAKKTGLSDTKGRAGQGSVLLAAVSKGPGKTLSH